MDIEVALGRGLVVAVGTVASEQRTLLVHVQDVLFHTPALGRAVLAEGAGEHLGAVLVPDMPG